MVKPFPVRESSILSLSELISRLLGLLFLAQFVSRLGLEVSAAFRITLPLIGVAAAFGSIGLPQALTRLFAAAMHPHGSVSRSDLLTSLLATCFAVTVTFVMLSGLVWFTASEHLDKQELSQLLQDTLPLLLLMCVTGSLRGVLFGLKSTYAPAVAQVLEVSTRLLVLYALLPIVIMYHSGWPTGLLERSLRSSLDRSLIGSLVGPLTRSLDGVLTGAQFGILTLTAGEAMAGVFLGAVLVAMLRRRGVHRESSASRSPLRNLFTLLRMSIASTGQSLLASLGYALELPLAQAWLSRTYNMQNVEKWIAEYAAIALPLLCAPMVLTDGMAAALLPLAATERASGGRRSFAIYVRRTLGVVAMVALPTAGALCVLAPSLTEWFGAKSAGALLLLLAPLTLPLYMQAPLASLLQAQGHSRALLLAGLCGDAARIGGLWLGIVYGQLGRVGLVFGFACSVLLHTTVLLAMAARLTPLRIPWRTISRSFQAACAVSALLLIAVHAPAPFAFHTHPLIWGTLAVGSLLFLLLITGEITPQGLSSLPLVGKPLGHMSQKVVRRLLD